MHDLTDHELDLAGHGAGQARLITASTALTNFLITHEGMPPLDSPSIRFSFTMPAGATDQQRAYRLGEVAEWLREQVVDHNGTRSAYRDFGGLALGAHFTPQAVKKQRVRQLLEDLGSGGLAA